MRWWSATTRFIAVELADLRRCHSCFRESFGYISRPLPREDVDVWWWYVHEVVNIKLHKRSVSFKRALKRRVPFTVDDIWLLLGAMSCNTDNASRDADTSSATKRRGLCEFIRALCELLRVASTTAPHLARVASTLAHVCERWSDTRSSSLLRTLSDVRKHTLAEPHTEEFRARVKRMCVVKPAPP